MNLTGLIGKKLDQTQGFLEDGSRVPLSVINLSSNTVIQNKTTDRDGYMAVKLGFGTNPKAKSPIKGIATKAGLQETPRFFREIRLENESDLEVAVRISPDEVFTPGDIVDITGTSKGKGYAGVVKRHGFRGGPRTHGQSDRERAPGSIGQTTTPGRVYKGKRMAGNMGNDQVTIKNLLVMDVVDGILFVKGLIPGPRGSVVVINKVGTNKKFVPLFKLTKEKVENEVVKTAEVPVTEPVVEAPAEEPAVAAEVVEEKTEEVETKSAEVTGGTEEKEEAK